MVFSAILIDVVISYKGKYFGPEGGVFNIFG